MNHEPECFYTGERDDDEWRDAEDDPCICDIIISVRLDEREKAAQRILASYWRATDGVAKITLDTAIAAARGEDTE